MKAERAASLRTLTISCMGIQLDCQSLSGSSKEKSTMESMQLQQVATPLIMFLMTGIIGRRTISATIVGSKERDMREFRM
eukprot:8471967-Karenia_brevis.AAC.1